MGGVPEALPREVTHRGPASSDAGKVVGRANANSAPALPATPPDERIPVLQLVAEQEKPPRRASTSAEQDACRDTWAAYVEAHVDRYGVEPVRNAKVSAAIKAFVRRVGGQEAPGIARYYVGHCSAYYARRCHDTGAMLADAEKLRTEWATQRQVTGVTARQQERAGTMLSVVNRILAERGATG